MDGDVDLDASYATIRARYDAEFPPGDTSRAAEFSRSLRENEYRPIEENMPYDVNDCPPRPPEGYPVAWPVLDVIGNWNPDDTTPHLRIHQGLCRFDAATQFDRASAYREAELPFVLRDDPAVQATVERWNRHRPGRSEEYLTEVLGQNKTYRTDYSGSNNLMFYRTSKWKETPEGWTHPTRRWKMSYPDWLEKASNPNFEELGPTMPHWYFQFNYKSPDRKGYLYDELPFFRPTTETSFYLVDIDAIQGINCMFGMRGNTAAMHYDTSRNFIAQLGPGERRYILAHPDQCRNLALYPLDHPSGRHSAVNWTDPDLEAYPHFQDASANEVVLQAGDILYLPTNWFHHIVSLSTNYQCSTRSGKTEQYDGYIKECGL